MCSPNVLCAFFIAYRFQIAGYRDVHEYRDVKQKEPVSCSFCFHSDHPMEHGGGGGNLMKHQPDDRNEKITLYVTIVCPKYSLQQIYL